MPGGINGKLKLPPAGVKLVYVPAAPQTRAEAVFEDYLTRQGYRVGVGGVARPQKA